MIELYSHQQKAIEELHSGAILCGDVGTGKSITALAYYYIKECGGKINTANPLKNPKDIYIITTARKRDTFEWDKECSLFLLSTKRNLSICNVLVTIDSWNNINKYVDIENAFFIFDEQRVVGSGAWVKSFLKIVRHNHWILLSATPGDTWMDYIPVFIANGFYKNRTAFLREHVIFSRWSKFPKVERYLNVGKLMRLQKQILVSMAFEKSTVRHEVDIPVEYDKALVSFILRERCDPETNVPFQNISEVCYALRKAVNSDPSRLKEVLKIIRKKCKVIIFYNFDYELEILRTISDKLDIQVAEWNGKKHEPIPSATQWVYLVQYAAGAEGWNCIETDTIIFYSLNYSYRATAQASGRIDRLNTPFTNLYYYRLISTSVIDEAIARALENKEIFNEKTLKI